MEEKKAKQGVLETLKKNRLAAAAFFLLLLMAALLIAGANGAFGQKGETSSSGAPSSSPAAGAASGSAGAESGGSSAPASSDAGSSSPESGPQSAAAGTTTKEKFDRLAEGMTCAEAQAICGSGELVTEVGGTQVYEWRSPDSDGAFIRATFKGGKLTRKYKFGF